MEINEIKKILEAVLFTSDKPLSLKDFRDVLNDVAIDELGIEKLLDELKGEYEVSDKPYEIRFLAQGWIFATKQQYGVWIRRFLKRKPLRLSKPASEILAMIAYKQPITRAEIDEIRGVDSSWHIDNLIERKLVKVVGRKEALGRPLLYGTTQEFLKHLGLANLTDLPLMDADIIEKAEAKIAAANVAELPLYDEAPSSPEQIPPTPEPSPETEPIPAVESTPHVLETEADPAIATESIPSDSETEPTPEP
jgi:segregation and condensation protein B